jgi:tRNA dimethylallyltransferase
MSPSTVIVVAGPTAVGKTAVGIHLGQLLGAPVLSADSRQCYREMNIGVARPSPEELAQVPHFFIATHSITDTVNAAVFEQYALQVAEDWFSRQPYLLVVGGTGLYINAFLEGLDEMPGVPEDISLKVREQYATQGLIWLQQEVQQKDPVWYANGEIQNPHRLMRVLEFVEATGRSIMEFRGKTGAARPFNVLKIGLDLPRELLYERINARVDRMMEAGLLEEVKRLLPYRQEKALDTVGYKELFAYLEGETSLDQAVALIKQHTRNYAKRQLTWFRKDPDIHWFDARDAEGIQTFVVNSLGAQGSGV